MFPRLSARLKHTFAVFPLAFSTRWLITENTSDLASAATSTGQVPAFIRLAATSNCSVLVAGSHVDYCFTPARVRRCVEWPSRTDISGIDVGGLFVPGGNDLVIAPFEDGKTSIYVGGISKVSLPYRLS